MQRPIKFRAWDKQANRFVNDGDLKHYAVTLDGKVINFDSSGYDYIEHFDVVRCTGLKDKNGVEIYEGDILDGYCSLGRVKLGAVEWQQAKLRFYAPPRRAMSDADLFERMSRYEVIGNIYENPELLESK